MAHDDIDISELAALADGSLPDERAAELRRRVDADPELAAALARQERAVAALRSTADVSAPASLQARVRALGPEPARRSWGGWLVPAGAVAAIIVAVVGVFAIAGGGGGTDDFDALADIGDRAPALAAPAADPARPMLLEAEIDGVAFPDWEPEFGMAAVGARDDEIDGQAVSTIYYGDPDDPVAYSIVSGDALELPGDARLVTTDNGVDVRVLADGSGVTWTRGGHTCFLSGGGLGEEQLVERASWMGGGAVPF